MSRTLEVLISFHRAKTENITDITLRQAIREALVRVLGEAGSVMVEWNVFRISSEDGENTMKAEISVNPANKKQLCDFILALGQLNSVSNERVTTNVIASSA
jgi:RNase P/RNase MRP subunit POP5